MLPSFLPRLSDGVTRYVIYGGFHWENGAYYMPAEIYDTSRNKWTVLPFLDRRFSNPAGWVQDGHRLFLVRDGEVRFLSLRGLENGGAGIEQKEWGSAGGHGDYEVVQGPFTLVP